MCIYIIQKKSITYTFEKCGNWLEQSINSFTANKYLFFKTFFFKTIK